MSKSGFMNKRIPTVLGLFILLAGLGAGIVLVNRKTSLESKAGPTESPKNVKITNKGSNTFSVSWTTDIPMTGYLKYSEDPSKINLPAGDVRDQISGTSQSYTNHYVNVTGLGPNKTYYFVIGSGSQTYNESGKPYQIRTWQQTSTPPEDVVSGKVVGEDSSPVNGALIFLEAEGGETLSTISKNDGTWRLNLANSRDKEGKVLAYDSKTALLTIFVNSGPQGTATATTNTEKARPVADIVIGKNQNFVSGTETVSEIVETLNETANREATFEIVSSEMTATQDSESGIKFTYPAIEGELVATNSPEFRGMMTPGTSLKMKIGDLAEDVMVETDGTWKWTPASPLPSGAQTIEASYTDAQGAAKSLSRAFTIVAMGDIGGLPAFIATPSATPELTPEITPEITPTPTEVTTMPETENPELADTGSFGVFAGIIISGSLLLLSGRLRKKWSN